MSSFALLGKCEKIALSHSLRLLVLMFVFEGRCFLCRVKMLRFYYYECRLIITTSLIVKPLALRTTDEKKKFNGKKRDNISIFRTKPLNTVRDCNSA